MKTFRVMLTLALCLGLSTFAFAQPPELTVGKAGASDVIDGLLADGWKIVNPGILQKHHDDGRVETWGYGVDGRQWHVQQLERELGQMMVDYETSPSKALAKAIDVHWGLLDHSRTELQVELDRGPFQPVGGDRAMNKAGCTVSYSWNATASQNAVASADAAWSHSCGEQASTYAYAYTKKVYNGVTTQHSQTDPSGPGSNILSVANSSVSGGADTCYSYARAYVDPPESAFYEVTDSDSVCAPPVSVSILGPFSIDRFGSLDCYNETWSASVSGGTPGYTYQWTWNGAVVGSGSSYTRNVCGWHAGSYTLALSVTDSSSQTDGDTRTVQVIDWGGGGGGGCDPYAALPEPCY